MATSQTLQLILDLVDNTEGKFKEISNNFDALQKHTETIQNALQSVALYSGIAFGGLSAIILKSVSDYGAFNAEIQRTGAFVNATQDQLKDFSSAAIAAVEGTKFSAIDGAKALGNFVGGEVSAAEASKNLGDIINLALITKIDNLQDAVNLGSLALTVFKNDGMQMSNVMDIMATVASDVTTQTQSWSTALVNSAGAAKGAGLSFKDLNSVFATMVRGGANVQTISTALNSALVNIQGPAKQAKEELEKFGLSTTGLRNSLNQGVVPMLDYLKKGFDEASKSGEGFVFLQRVLGRQAASEFSLALGLTNDELHETVGWFDDINGAGKAMTDTLRGAEPPLTTLLGDFNKLSIALGGAISESFNKLLGAIQPVLSAVIQFATEHPKLTSAILLGTAATVGLIAALSSLGLILIVVSTGLGALAGEGTILGGIISTLTGRTVTWTGTVAVANSAWKILTATSITFRGTVIALTTVLGGLRTILMTLGWPIIIAGISAVISLFSDLSDTVGGFGNAFKYIWDTVVHNFAVGMKQLTDGLLTVGKYIPGIKGVLQDASDGFQKMADNANADMDKIIAAAPKTSDATADMSAKIAAAMDQAAMAAKTSLPQISEAAGEMTDAAKARFKDLADGLKDVEDKITQTYQDIKKATDDYNKSVSDENKSYQDSVVDTVAEAESKKADLQKQLKDAQKNGKDEQVEDLRKQIAEQQSILDSYKSMNLNLDTEIDQARKVLAMNDLERLAYNHQKKLDTAQAEFEDEQAKRLQTLVELAAQHDAILALTDSETAKKVQAEAIKQQAASTRLLNEKQGLTTWISQTTQMYRDYVTSLNQILSQVKSIPSIGNVSVSTTKHRAAGGPVSAGTTYLVGEKGPELFSPSTSGRITANNALGGSSINIYVTGNSFVGEEGIADKISKEIMSTLTRNMKIS